MLSCSVEMSDWERRSETSSDSALERRRLRLLVEASCRSGQKMLRQFPFAAPGHERGLVSSRSRQHLSRAFATRREPIAFSGNSVAGSCFRVGTDVKNSVNRLRSNQEFFHTFVPQSVEIVIYCESVFRHPTENLDNFQWKTDAAKHSARLRIC